MHFETVSNDEHVSIIKARVSYEMDLHGNTITYQYDSNGNLKSITDPSGRIITFNYDTGGLVVNSVLEGRKTVYNYQNGKLISFDQYSDDGTYSRTQFSYGGNYIKSIFDPNNRLTTYTYNQELLEMVQEPAADNSNTDIESRPGTTYSYDLSQHTANVRDPNGNTTYYTLDSNYVPIKIKDAVGSDTYFTLDENYNSKVVVNPDGTSIQRIYDTKGNVLSETDEVGNITENTYNNLSLVTTETDPLKHVTTYHYNDVGDLEKMIDPKQQITSYSYDTYGNLKSVTNPDNTVETYAYDDKGNDVKTFTDAVGNTTTTITDNVGNIISETDGNGNTTHFDYDKLNRLKEVEDAVGNKASYDYDSAGNLKKSINAKQANKSYEYNGLNQVNKEIDALGKVTQHKYSPNGNLIETITPNENIITNTYTPTDQLETMSIDGLIKWNYKYNQNGELESVNNGLRSFVYRKNGQVEKEIDRNNIKVYDYTTSSLIRSLSYIVGEKTFQVHYDYNELDQIDKIFYEDNQLITYGYNSTGDLTQSARSNGIKTKAHYGDGNQLETFGDYTSSGEAIREYNYNYDGNGNINEIQTKSGIIKYNYDKRNQLEQEILTDGTIISYTYDSVGNRDSKIVTKGETINTSRYVFNLANQLVSKNDQLYQYDDNGNLINDGEKTYVYDALNQLTEIKDPSGQQILKAEYDEEGRRTRLVTLSEETNYFYDGEQVIYETDANNNIIVQYVWDEDSNPVAMIKNGKTYFYHLNGHADVVSLTDEAGNEVASYDYDAWGNIISESGSLAEENPYRYAGYRFDSITGLYYLMARYYNPENGNFLTTDPDSGILEEPLNQNGYSYAMNNPVTLTDSNGENPFVVFIVITIAKSVVKAIVKKAAKKAIGKSLKRGATSTAYKSSQKVAKSSGRTGKQARLRELANDDKISSSLRGELKRDINSINKKRRNSIRVPQGYQLAHRRGYEARKGFGYKYSDLQTIKSHKTQHKFDKYGKIRK